MVMHMLEPLAGLVNLVGLTLDVRENQIGDLGTENLLKPLVALSNLQALVLDLGWNKIGGPCIH